LADVLTPVQRRLNMSRIRGKDTKPEMLLRRSLHARGLRYRLHSKGLPGHPDLVFPRHRAIIFVHGCFWHGHRCALSKIPTTRTEFWIEKIDRNVQRDRGTIRKLRALAWRVMIVWECAMRGKGRLSSADLAEQCVLFVKSNAATNLQIAGVTKVGRV